MKKTELQRALAAARQRLATTPTTPTPDEQQPGTSPDGVDDVGRARADAGVPLADADACVADVVAYLRNIGVQRLEIAGDLRRRCDVVQDVVLLVAAPRPQRIMRSFLAYPRGEAAEQEDASRARITLACGLPIDLRIVPARCFGAMLHTLTGSEAHNEAVRRYGMERGVRVSDYGLFRVTEGKAGARRIGGQREEDVFDALGVDWIPPELREDAGELDAAARHSLPKLVALPDVRGEFRLESCDVAALGPLLRACTASALDYCVVVELPGSAGRAQRLAQLVAARDALGAPAGRVFVGVEAAIRADGSLDITDDERDLADVLFVGLHAQLRMSAAKLTARVVAAITQPGVHVLAVDRVRSPVRLDLDEVFAAAAAHNVAIEIGAADGAAALTHAQVRRIAEFGATAVVTSGAAAPGEVALMRFAVDRARRGWLEAGHVLNTRAPDDVMRWLQR